MSLFVLSLFQVLKLSGEKSSNDMREADLATTNHNVRHLSSILWISSLLKGQTFSQLSAAVVFTAVLSFLVHVQSLLCIRICYETTFSIFPSLTQLTIILAGKGLYCIASCVLKSMWPLLLQEHVYATVDLTKKRRKTKPQVIHWHWYRNIPLESFPPSTHLVLHARNEIVQSGITPTPSFVPTSKIRGDQEIEEHCQVLSTKSNLLEVRATVQNQSMA